MARIGKEWPPKRQRRPGAREDKLPQVADKVHRQNTQTRTPSRLTTRRTRPNQEERTQEVWVGRKGSTGAPKKTLYEKASNSGETVGQPLNLTGTGKAGDENDGPGPQHYREIKRPQKLKKLEANERNMYRRSKTPTKKTTERGKDQGKFPFTVLEGAESPGRLGEKSHGDLYI